MPLFHRFIVRPMTQEPWRTAITVIGIALGIAVVLAMRLANASAVRGFETALEAMSGKTSLEIVSPGVGIDERRLSSLDWLAEFGTASPVIEGDAGVRTEVGHEAVRVLGVDILRDRALREYRLEAAGARGALTARELLSLLLEPDAIILTHAFAARRGVGVGRAIELSMGDRARTFIVRGLLGSEGPARALDGNFAIMDIATAQVAFGRLGRIDRIDLRLLDPDRVDASEQAIAARLPPGLSVQRPSRRGAQVEKMLAAFHFNLTALSYIALVVGLFLVYNTVSVSVIARREEIGVLRALGTTRRRVLILFLGEGAALALIGCALGLGIGRALASAAVTLTSATVTTLYVAAAAIVPPLDWSQVALAFGIGLPLSLVAAAAPALEAARVTPLAAVRGSVLAERARPPSLTATPAIAAAVLIGLAAVLSQQGPVRGLPLFGLGAAIALVFGGAFLVPGALGLLAVLAARPLTKMFAIAGRLAHANLAGSLSRLSVSVAALSLSLSMMVAVAVMIGSFRETVMYWVGQTLQADLYISPARRSGSSRDAAIAPEVERRVRAHPQVAAVDRFRSINVPYGEALVGVASGEFAVLLSHGSLLFKGPADGRAALAQGIGRDAVVISEAFALKYRLSAGDRLTLPTPAGPAGFDVLAVYYDYSSERGFAVMDRTTFVRHFGDARPASLTVYLREGAEPDRVRAELLAATPDEHRLFVHTNASLRREVLRIFDSTFAITYALEAIAIFVAILGVAGTLLTLVLERRRELSMLRLVGASRRQVRAVVMIEAGLLGVVCQCLGLLVGLGLSLILIYVINVQSFGWTIQFHLPVGFLVQSSLLVLTATILSGLYPARIAGRLATIDRVVEE